MTPIYLDYAATTPLDPHVAQEMQAYLTKEGIFGNPASQHFYGLQAKKAIDTAREQVAAVIGSEPSEIIWTSGATESNNLALKGAAHLYQRKGKHLITLKTEHKSVLDTCQQLEKEGYEVTYLMPKTNGLIELDALKAAIRDDTILISIMHVNNETGIIQPLSDIAELTAARGILFHVDAAQSIGKVAINLKSIPVDLLSLSAHKVYGPKGIGALFLRKKPRVRVEPLIHGGGHEQGMRSGTLPTHQIISMGVAFHLAQEKMDLEVKKIRYLRDQFVSGLKKISCLNLNSDFHHTVPHIVNVRFEKMVADAMLKDLTGLCASTASACQGKGTEGSYVLRAMGFLDEQIKSSIRFSFGRFTTEADIQTTVSSIRAIFQE